MCRLTLTNCEIKTPLAIALKSAAIEHFNMYGDVTTTEHPFEY